MSRGPGMSRPVAPVVRGGPWRAAAVGAAMRAGLRRLATVAVVVLAGAVAGAAAPQAPHAGQAAQAVQATQAAQAAPGPGPHETPPAPDRSHLTGGPVYRLVDRAGRTITWTALGIGVGDTYIDADNSEYRVVAVEGSVARVQQVGRITLPDVSRISLAAPPRPRWAAWSERLLPAQFGEGRGPAPIAIYHTHSDESYTRPSGPPSEDWGEIYEVGRALKEALEAEGYRVVWSRNNHNPHDGQAYQRSRRTVQQLLRERPVTMIDVHRDAVPHDIYSTQVGGTSMTKVRIVVGRQNPNRGQNLEYAKRLKALADRELPGIIQGIFHAQGNYNQDFGPQMILLEFGTHINDKGRAIAAARTFAPIIPAAAGLTAENRGPAGRQAARGAIRSLLGILLVVGVGVVGYLWVNEGSLGGALARIQRFWQREGGRVTGEGGPGGGPPDTRERPPGAGDEDGGGPGGPP